MKKEKKLQLGKITIQNLTVLNGKAMGVVHGGSQEYPLGTTNMPIFC